jgi:type IV pilus assembly protein PilB
LKRRGLSGGTVAPADEWESLDLGSPTAPAGPQRPAVVAAKRLGQVLLDLKLLARSALDEALRRQEGSGKRLGELLLEVGAIHERELYAALADHLRLPLVDLRRHTPDPEAAATLAEDVARTLGAIPVGRKGDVLRVAVSEPSTALRQKLVQASGRKVELLLAPPSDVAWAIDQSYRALAGISQHVTAFQTIEAARRSDEPAADLAAEDAPVVHVVNLVITQALRDRSSDIHIEPQGERLRIRYRVDGALQEVLSLPQNMAAALVSRIKIMAGMNIVERRRAQDGQIALELDSRPVDIRVATTPTLWGEKAVLRLLDKSRPLYRLEDLGMPDDTHVEVSKLIRSPFGMVICAGPTGSGKTTTLYAGLTEINSPEANITTIEDPVEFVFPSINQIQINEQAGVTFAGGLRSILRQDPDVILVGEIRDVETARIAVQSALTGHLVLSSLHATDAASALQRFVDMGVESFLVASSVLGVISQRLVRRICPHCRVTYKPPPEELAFYREAGGPPKREFWRGDGCNYCSQTGYHDRMGVFELLRLTEEVKQMLIDRVPHGELRARSIAGGMRPLRTEAARLVSEDVTTIAEVIRKIYLL